MIQQIIARITIRIAIAVTATSLNLDDTKNHDLAMTKPVFCDKIHGFANFEPRASTKFTPDDKMTIYVEPTDFKIEHIEKNYRAILTQDVRIRRPGVKTPVWSQDNLFRYEAKNSYPPYQVFLRTEISLKGLPVGDYELDLILHDGLIEKSARQRTISFQVVKGADEPMKIDEDKPKSKKPPKPGGIGGRSSRIDSLSI